MTRFITHLFFVLFMSTFPSSAQTIDWQGHRGCRGLMPENTLQAFEEAMKYPVTTLELDVVISKDKKVVVSHEPWISDKICLNENGKEFRDNSMPTYNLFEMDYSSIRQFDCGVKPNESYPYQQKIKAHKPLLSEVFERIEALDPEGSMRFNIEIKSAPEGDGKFHPEIEEFTDLVVALVREYVTEERFTIQSFDFRVLEYCRETYPGIKLAMLVESGTVIENLDQLSFTPDIYSPYFRKLNKKEVELCHSKEIKVIPWTVNTPSGIRKMLKMGVDGIITDYPNLIAQFQ